MNEDQIHRRIEAVFETAKRVSDGDGLATFTSVLGALGLAGRLTKDPVISMGTIIAMVASTMVQELGAAPEAVALAAVRAATGDDRRESLGVACSLLGLFLRQGPDPGEELDNVIKALTSARPDIVSSAAWREEIS